MDFHQLAALILDESVSSHELEKKLSQTPKLQNLKNGLGQSLIFTAIASEKERRVESVRKYKLSLQERDSHGRSVLHWAIKWGLPAMAKFILGQEPALITANDNFGVTPLHLAASQKRPRFLLKLLVTYISADTNLEPRDKQGRTPLHYAAEHGSLEAVQFFFENESIVVDPLDHMDQTPLMVAAGNTSAISLLELLAHKKPASIGKRNTLGQTALHIAVLANNLDALPFLLTRETVHLAASMDNNERTPLHYAATMGRTEAAKFLLEHGAKVESCDASKATAAHYAAQTCVETLKVIMEAIPPQTTPYLDNEDRCCFMWAVLAKNEPAIVWMLASKSLSINRQSKDINLCSALHLAAQVGSLSITRLLVQQGWSATDCDIDHATPVHLAAGKGHTELIRYFQTTWVKTEDFDGAVGTPLFYACAAGQASTAKIMVEDLGFSVAVVDRVGQTPLHHATASSNPACVKIFLDRPECDINAADHFGVTALHIACGLDRPDIALLLIDAGAAVNVNASQLGTPLEVAEKKNLSVVVERLRWEMNQLNSQ